MTHRTSQSLLALFLTLLPVPAMAQTLYSNGPTNGNTDAWTVNLGSIVSDTFNVAGNDTTITGATFAMWVLGGVNVDELSITSSENGGTVYFDQFVNFTQSGCMLNQYGYDVCNESTTFNGPTLNAGTYWLNLQGCEVPGCAMSYWDENSGPSQASDNLVGSIPSESFTVFGREATGSVPEPGGALLLGSGIVGLAAGKLRCKLF
ncbi:MAG TPA: hypothetical protein VKB58_02880 [Terriglobales bacterium]|jgi:hypothetical protein|nr:hypothetical protein [Terriglobales bacterium]